MIKENAKYVMATIGPTFEKAEDFEKALRQNCKWFRFPFSYRDRDHINNAILLHEVALKENIAPVILADLPSERPRLGDFENFSLERGKSLILKSSFDNLREGIPVKGLEKIIGFLNENERILFLDGRIVCRITEIFDETISLVVISGSGTLKPNNSLFLPDSKICYNPVMTEDITLLKALEEKKIFADWVILSMISEAQDVISAKKLLSANLSKMPLIMSKIETSAALENLEEIISISDGVMVARGDLGQSIPYYSLPNAEKKIVEIANFYGKVVFIATQSLEIFSVMGVPQRAELIDLATVKWLNADGIMLGKETVWSSYPIESIILAKEILNRTENLNLSWLNFCKHSESPIIAIEGPDGVGKTTVVSRLGSKGYKTIRGVLEEWERPDIKRRMINPTKWISSALYFLSGAIEAASSLKKNKKALVISDRSVWSSIVVHYKKSPKLLPELCSLLSLIAPYTEFPKKVIVLNAGFENVRKRILSKNLEEKQNDLLLPQTREVYEREILFFEWLKNMGVSVSVIDASGTQEEVEIALLKEIDKL